VACHPKRGFSQSSFAKASEDTILPGFAVKDGAG